VGNEGFIVRAELAVGLNRSTLREGLVQDRGKLFRLKAWELESGVAIQEQVPYFRRTLSHLQTCFLHEFARLAQTVPPCHPPSTMSSNEGARWLSDGARQFRQSDSDSFGPSRTWILLAPADGLGTIQGAQRPAWQQGLSPEEQVMKTIQNTRGCRGGKFLKCREIGGS